jgi:small-conductance mechanosensitive channel
MMTPYSFHSQARNIAIDAGIMNRLVNDMVNAHGWHKFPIDRNGQQDLEDALRALRRVAQSIDEHLLVEKESAA